MSILVDRDILAAMERGSIVITPFDRKCLGTNSYDVHLAPTLRTYVNEQVQPFGWGTNYFDCPLDAHKSRDTRDINIPGNGYILEPGELYLASTVEHTESKEHVPMLNGRSSTGRLGLSIHVTAGTGDVGFRGPWTMELTVVKRLRVYAGDAIGQLLWFYPSSRPLVSYGQKPSAKYNDAGALPQPSKLHEERS